MSSLVLDLQKELMDRDCDILQALRHAHVIAVKLRLDEFDKWIQYELNGYPKNDEVVPKYRFVTGTLKAKNPRLGWIPAVIMDKSKNHPFNTMPMYESLASLIEIKQQATSGVFHYEFPPALTMELLKYTDSPIYMDVALFVSVHNISETIEQVKNHLLEWTLELEKKGILGENMTFNRVETLSAKTVTSPIINVYGTYVEGDVNHSQIVSGDNNSATYNEADAKATIEEIKASIKTEEISKDSMECILEILDDISSKIEQKKKPGIIKTALIGLKDFVLSAGANITAALITAKIQDLF
ncbi:MAG: ABC transporter substrate-binding protein [Clostridia bacterium]|nr:ABC transporter substrate-binding protein [Clostridia bacterium]